MVFIKLRATHFFLMADDAGVSTGYQQSWSYTVFTVYVCAVNECINKIKQAVNKNLDFLQSLRVPSSVSKTEQQCYR